MKVVHHIDGNPRNNDPANLLVMDAETGKAFPGVRVRYLPMSPAPNRDPWRSHWLRWLEEVQNLCGLRAYDAATYRQLVARHSVGESPQDAADWLLTLAPNQASPSQTLEIAAHD